MTSGAVMALLLLEAAGCGSGSGKQYRRCPDGQPAVDDYGGTAADQLRPVGADYLECRDQQSPVVVAAPPSPASPALTGFGAALADWNGAHTLDSNVPAGNAYLPHVPGGDDPRTDTWQLDMAPGGHVNSYTINLAPTSFTAALARARQPRCAERVLRRRRAPDFDGPVTLR